MDQKAKFFGVALDASDDPLSLQLKRAAMAALESGTDNLPRDPYDVLAGRLARMTGLEAAGRFPVPSRLGPLPGPEDREFVSAEAMERFIDAGGVPEMIDGLKAFVRDRILPATPVMLGIDHSASGGVVSAVAEHIGPDLLTVIVFDRHFDALPVSLRAAAFGKGKSQGLTCPGGSANGDDLPSRHRKARVPPVCCGDFWSYLIDQGIIDPRHMVFVGVADYPPEETPEEWAAFKEGYRAFEERGCRFFTLGEFTDGYEAKLEAFLEETISTPYVYVSLDLDVGSYRAVRAARYMDGPGLDARQLLGAARVIRETIQERRLFLAGLDVVEFNMHFLGLRTDDGEKDDTAGVAFQFIRTIMGN